MVRNFCPTGVTPVAGAVSDAAQSSEKRHQHHFQNMRYLLLFMFCVGLFVVGKRAFHFSGNGLHFGPGTRGTGPVVVENRSVTGFRAVNMQVSGEVEVSVSDSFRVEVHAQGNLLPLLKTEVKDGALQIYFDESVSYSEDLKVRVSGPAFDGLSVGGSGSIRMLTPISAEKMHLDVAGSGDVYVPQATFQSATCSIAGSGGIHLGGSANELRSEIAGSGDVKAKDLTVNNLSVGISGSGSVTANVVQTLKADISGSGDVRYTGQPTVEAKVSGSGSVKRAN
jgi:hypothetical protein